MKIKLLGSGAGGGVPQWNCNCPNCADARYPQGSVAPRTQSSIAVFASGLDWVLVNASPDLLAQLRAHPCLQPARAIRDSGIAAVVLTDAQIDHVTGLLMLRERTTPLPIYACAPVFDDLTTSLPIVNVLSHYCGVERCEIAPGESFSIAPVDGVRFTALAVQSKTPPYSTRCEAAAPGDNIALVIESLASAAQALYAPGLAVVTPEIETAMREASLVLVDGTFWSQTEMIDLGLSPKRSGDMGHLAQCGNGGAAGMVQWLDTLPATTRKVLVHINNTNPILDPCSPQHATLRMRGIEVAHDGMEFEL